MEPLALEERLHLQLHYLEEHSPQLLQLLVQQQLRLRLHLEAEQLSSQCLAVLLQLLLLPQLQLPQPQHLEVLLCRLLRRLHSRLGPPQEPNRYSSQPYKPRPFKKSPRSL